MSRIYNTVFNNVKFAVNLNKCQLLITRSVTSRVKNATERQEQKKILQDNLGLSYQRSAAFIRKNEFLHTLDNKRLLDTIKSLKNNGILPEDICEHPNTLIIQDNTVEHNILYLQEAGFTRVSAQILLRFRTIVKKPISLLKAHQIIPDHIDVPTRLFSYLKPKPSITKFKILNDFTEEDSIFRIHEVVFKHYLVWRLETTLEEVDRVFKIYEGFKFKSFELVSELIKILIKEFEFSNQRILQNAYLFLVNPAAIRKTMKLFPTLAGVDIKTVFYKYPKIISVPTESIIAIEEHLKNFNISDEAIQKCFEIFTLAPDTVLYRLNELKTVPEFNALSKNHRIVQLVLCQNKAKLRLEHLQKLKVKCASIHVLCASDSVYEKYAQEGNDRTMGYDIVNYLAQEFEQDFKIIRDKLTINKHWYHVPLTTVQSSLKFLLDKQFPKKDVSDMPIILLYPKKKIKDALREIYLNPETGVAKLSSKQRLNLCLYFIERKHYFSGDGLWQQQTSDVDVSSN